MRPIFYTNATASENYSNWQTNPGITNGTIYINYVDNHHYHRYQYDDLFDRGTSTSTSDSILPYLNPYTTLPYGLEVRQQSQPVPPKHQSPDEIRREEEERVKARELAEKAEKESKIAEERAKILLLEHLDDENKQKYEDNEPLEIASKLFNDIKYQIPISRIGRIKALKENQVISELCLVVNEAHSLPTDDVVLAKLLYTKNDEENMLRTANHSGVKESLLARLN